MLGFAELVIILIVLAVVIGGVFSLFYIFKKATKK